MYVIKSEIEISASPEVVRQKFLDFAQIPTYHPDGFFKLIIPDEPDKPIEAGDKLTALINFTKLNPTVLENSPTCFSWEGFLPLGAFKGNHSFRFEPSLKTEGGTTFKQTEEFTGPLAFIIGEGLVARSMGLREQTQNGFESYNKDLKVWCETS